MLRLIFIFLLLMVSVWAGVVLTRDPGRFYISVNQWSVESTFTVGIIVLCLLFYVLHLLLLSLNWLFRAPTAWKNWLHCRKVHKAQKITRQGLIEFTEGYWQKARNHLIQALPNTDTPLLNYLTAARAAQEMGDSHLRDEYLRQAQHSMPEAKIAVELTQAQLQLANQQWEQALATLRHLQTLAPNHPYVLKLLMHLYQEVKDWPQLIALLPELRRHHIVTESEFKPLEHHTYLQMFKDLARLGHIETLKNCYKHLPNSLQNDPEMLTVYCGHLLRQGEEKSTEALLRHALQKHFSDPLLNLYGQLKGNEATLKFAESLLKEHPHSAALYLCLGHLSLTQQLWGKAKTYLEESIAIHPTPEAYEVLGHLLQQLQDEPGACNAYRQGLLLFNRKDT